MEEGKRQRQVAGAIQEEMNDIFRRLNLSMLDGGMVSISSVKVTPDLLEARIYLSLFQVKDAKATMKTIEGRAWEIKKELADKMKHQLRRIPVLHFYLDDTLDYVFKMEEIFKNISEEKKGEGNE
ncbi:MAG: 30S ribosome-binding factor RbfA [Sediminibacterium sp. Gen4]|jgi:ribosome-binding factor A|uniref:30S ribosome-binding factor RbfA n=1 Tax=unclassified Sediminibacterium TaxID=2635961 RepID=UPI0015BA92EA|nr:MULTISPECIES: 30S ribosome-binding factor RbfA [unclassified Sediminibacterium]MBW0160168.1 30S ribosome-binding factor RbfA [Sediminibacterium sp.]MBW0164449.1 30S ribosome-binding factor RbfA [Sediminibacterium sp.]NWK64835.1 30S ribosome-binding factor RbfA [Sediminibacterium sp. Gen4]